MGVVKLFLVVHEFEEELRVQTTWCWSSRMCSSYAYFSKGQLQGSILLLVASVSFSVSMHEMLYIAFNKFNQQQWLGHSSYAKGSAICNLHQRGSRKLRCRSVQYCMYLVGFDL